VRTQLIPLRGPARDIQPWSSEGSHGGGDDVMLTGWRARRRRSPIPQVPEADVVVVGEREVLF
jgi:hypothetical protein